MGKCAGVIVMWDRLGCQGLILWDRYLGDKMGPLNTIQPYSLAVADNIYVEGFEIGVHILAREMFAGDAT